MTALSTSSGVLVDALSARPTAQAAGNDIVDLSLALADGPATIHLVVPAKPIRLSQLLPITRLLSSRIMSSSVRQATAHGQRVFCHKGCGTCCRYLVPLSVPEAMSLYEHVEDLPEPQRRGVLRTFNAAARKIACAGRPRLSEGCSRSQEDQAVSDWYSKLNLACPFLRDQACREYALRPLACREHLSLTPPSLCGDHSAATGQRVILPLSLVTCLADVTAQIEHREVESVLMPLSLLWAKSNLSRVRRSWPAPLLVKLLAERVKDCQS